MKKKLISIALVFTMLVGVLTASIPSMASTDGLSLCIAVLDGDYFRPGNESDAYEFGLTPYLEIAILGSEDELNELYDSFLDYSLHTTCYFSLVDENGDVVFSDFITQEYLPGYFPFGVEDVGLGTALHMNFYGIFSIYFERFFTDKDRESGIYTYISEFKNDDGSLDLHNEYSFHYTGWNGAEPTDISLELNYPDLYFQEYLRGTVTLTGENGLPVQLYDYAFTISLLDENGDPSEEYSVSGSFATNTYGKGSLPTNARLPDSYPAGTYRITVTAGDVSDSRTFEYHGAEDGDTSIFYFYEWDYRLANEGYKYGDYIVFGLDINPIKGVDAIDLSLKNSDGEIVGEILHCPEWAFNWTWFPLMVEDEDFGFVNPAMETLEAGDYTLVVELYSNGVKLTEANRYFKYLGNDAQDDEEKEGSDVYGYVQTRVVDGSLDMRVLVEGSAEYLADRSAAKITVTFYDADGNLLKSGSREVAGNTAYTTVIANGEEVSAPHDGYAFLGIVIKGLDDKVASVSASVSFDGGETIELGSTKIG